MNRSATPKPSSRAGRGPQPAAVRGNDWRGVDVAPIEEFTPFLRASVVVPYYEAPEALELTLAALAGQTYPRRLFEVIAVDDGSKTPLRKPEGTGLDLKIMRQERRGFGAGRARNKGARAASGDFLVFLDCDMMPEAEWLAAHARWHHALSDVLTLGFRAHVEADGVDAAMVEGREGSLEELFSDRPAERPEWIEFHMARTNELTSTADDIFRVVTSGNLGVSKEFFEAVGGFDESFTQWGAEDTEFGYRAYTKGALLAPERAAFCWHQGPGASPSEDEVRSLDLQQAKIAHLIAHNSFRRASPGRTFTVPQHVVTLESGETPAEEVFAAAVCILGDRMHDLAVLIEDRPDGSGWEWLRRQLGPDPRVRFGPPGAALDLFPASPFHITCPPGAAPVENMIYTLRNELGGAASAVLVLEGGARVSISRSWALHRSRRSGRRPAELGAAVSVKAEKMVLDLRPWRPPLTAGRVLRRLRGMARRVWGPIWVQRWAVRRVYKAVAGIRSPRRAWQVLRWAAEAVRSRVQAVFRFALRRPPDSSAAYPLGMEIAVRGERSEAVLAASARVRRAPRRRSAQLRVDLVLADRPEAAARAPTAGIPAAVLTEAPPQISVPAFDPQAVNPIGWARKPKYGAGALGPLELLPPGAAERSVEASDRGTLRLLHHLEDCAAFHSGPVERAAALAALAARGVVVHLAGGEQDRGLEPLLGPELYGSMASPRIRGADPGERELISAAMRRAALRGHSLRSRARQIMAAASLEPPPLTRVSVLAPARRPALLPALLSAVSRQTYPRLELVLTLCGGGFGPEAEQAAEDMPCPVRVVRADAALPLGAALNLAAQASRGVLITVMDDRHLYGPEHIWDLVLAREYSAAELVVKETEFVYLAAAGRTLRRSTGPGEGYPAAASLADGALLLSRRRLEEAGGWKRAADGLEESLAHDVVSAGGRVYRTHGAGLALAAAGRDRPAWLDDGCLLAQVEEVREGWDPAFCGLPASAVPHLDGEGAAPSETPAPAAAAPRPAAVRGNDWRGVDVAPIEEFTPVLGVSVVVPYYEAPEALELTLAALAGQTYPRDLFEVVVVDDGSKIPLERPEGTGLDLRVVHQEDLGFGLARARNTGAAAARRGVLVFLDCDMMPEAGWLAAHARWHHALSDALTLGFRGHVEVDGVDAAMVEGREGSLEELFSGRPAERPEWIEFHMTRTNELTSTADDLFRVVTGGNLGVSKEFFEAVGGFDESFTQWGAEDTEFGYRAYTRGGLLVPERAAFCWHQGPGASPSEDEMRSRELQRAKIAHLIAHYGFRGDARGRSFTVPQYAVSLESGNAPAEDVFLAAERILGGRVHDLAVRIEDRPDDPDFEWLRRQLDPDPRVSFGSPASALDDFPVSAFHVSAPAGAELMENLVQHLRAELGEAASAVLVLEGGARASITRTWAMHRSRRSAGSIDRWGDRKTAPAGKAGSTARAVLRSRLASRRMRKAKSKAARVLYELRQVRSFRQAWWFLRWFAAAAGRRLKGARRYRLMQIRSGFRPGGGFLPAGGAGRLGGSGAAYPLGAEMIALGPRAGRVFAASTRVRRFFDGRHVDLVLADDPGSVGEAAEAGVPSVVLSESSSWLSVPAFDLLSVNPVRWVREPKYGAAAIGPLDLLPPGSSARRRVDRRDRRALSQVHHLEDAAGFHSGVVERAGALAALAGMGVVVRLAGRERDPELESLLGAELYGLMAAPGVLDGDLDRREAVSIAMRREALRSHSLPARARQVISAGLPDPPVLADVSILAPTKRPRMVPEVLAAAASQTYPRLELVLVLHGMGFGAGVRADIEAQAAGLPFPVRVLAAGGELNLGELLNLASEAAEGDLLTKLDDDDLYGSEHVWDLVLARQYSEAELVAKGAEFVYLAGSDLTVHRFCGKGEAASSVVSVAGGTLLLSRCDLEEAGGWRRAPRGVDTALIEDVRRAGGSVYRTHGFGYVLVRHGSGHTWESGDGYFLRQAEAVRKGWDPVFAGLDPGTPRPGGAAYPLGAEMIALGPRAGRVFAASTRVRRFFDGRHVDLVLADDPGSVGEAAEAGVPSVVLSESSSWLSVPAFDLLSVNPVRWVREPKYGAAAIGPLDLLPPGSSARRRVDRRDRRALSQVHHLEDAAGFHSGVVERAGALAALAGMGVVVRLAGRERDPELESLLGAELYGLMAAPGVLDGDLDRREAVSIAMRREALRSHSLPARARQVISAGLPDPPVLADVSILAPTKRPRMVPEVLAAAASQTYPRLELVLVLHGMGFGAGVRADIEAQAAGLPFPVRVLAAGGELNLGELLNLASEAAEGDLLTKLDDDDLYGSEHVWDLVLARQYSEAELVAKGAEFVYLAGSDLTVHRFCGKGEAASSVVSVAGGTLLLSRCDLEEAGGWRRAPRGVDTALIEDVRRAGGSVYRTHGFGYVLVRHGSGHTWESGDGYFLRQAEAVRKGWDPVFAGLDPGTAFPEALRPPDPA